MHKIKLWPASLGGCIMYELVVMMMMMFLWWIILFYFFGLSRKEWKMCKIMEISLPLSCHLHWCKWHIAENSPRDYATLLFYVIIMLIVILLKDRKGISVGILNLFCHFWITRLHVKFQLIYLAISVAACDDVCRVSIRSENWTCSAHKTRPRPTSWEEASQPAIQGGAQEARRRGWER